MQRDVFCIIHPSAGAVVLAGMIENLNTDEDVDAAGKLTVEGILESAEAVLMSLRLPPAQVFDEMCFSIEVNNDFASKDGHQDWFFP